MERQEKMFSWEEEWNISFAGCGFRSIYYLGALSCIFQHVPRLVQGASRICGASSGCLVAAAVAVGIPVEELCVDVLSTAREARKHRLGVFHPTFSLLRTVRESLQEKLPEDAHLRASGRLCVSLTRMADGENVLVSEFESREELIQVLTCSCFFPVYCGFTPPSYRGVRYMDGALSNNMPLFEHRNTITVAPFSGESDICPKEGTFSFLEVHYGNLSIQVNTNNVHRVCTSFLPPGLETLAAICHGGYKDALRFLRERDLLEELAPLPNLAQKPRRWCCEPATEATRVVSTETNLPEAEHQWLELKTIENLPVGLKRVLCAACRDTYLNGGQRTPLTQSLPVRLLCYLLTPLALTFDLGIWLTSRVQVPPMTGFFCKRLVTLTLGVPLPGLSGKGGRQVRTPCKH